MSSVTVDIHTLQNYTENIGIKDYLTLNQRVLGSSPSAPTNLFKGLEKNL